MNIECEIESESEDEGESGELFKRFSSEICLENSLCTEEVLRCYDGLIYQMFLSEDMLVLHRNCQFYILHLDISVWLEEQPEFYKFKFVSNETNKSEELIAKSEHFSGFSKKLRQVIAQKNMCDTYKIVGLIGCGRASKVLKLQHKASKMLYAAKFYQQIPVDLEKEIRILRQLDHPNLIYFIEFYLNNSGVYLIMNYEDGGSLLELIQCGYKFKLKERVNLMVDLLNGLEFLRIKGIVHRDLKPENIIYSHRDNRFKIGDFGLAEPCNLKYRRIVGTPGYLSPECFDEEFHRTTDVKSDIFSLGTPYYIGKSVDEILCNNRKGKKFHTKSELFTKQEKKMMKLMLKKDIKDRKNSLEILQSSEMSESVKHYLHGIEEHNSEENKNAFFFKKNQGLLRTVIKLFKSSNNI